MTDQTLVLEWVRTLGSILISWPTVGLIALIVFQRPLRALAVRMTSDDMQRLKAGMLEVEFSQVKAQVQQTMSQVERLYALSMSEDAFNQLRKLATGSYGPFYLDPELNTGLALELAYFKILGYIALHKEQGYGDTRELPRGNHPEDNLSNYVSITPQGRDFIALREQAQRH